MTTSTTTGLLPAAPARRWVRATAQQLAEWGHGHLAAATDGGVAIAGLANTRGCCWQPMPIEAATGTVVLQRPLPAEGGETRCVNCGQALPLSRWAHWDGPAAGAIAAEIAFARPHHLDPYRPWPAQGAPQENRKHWLTASESEMRGRRAPSRFGQRRAALRWAKARMPSPEAALAVAATGRGLAQRELLRSAESRCQEVLAAVPRTGTALVDQWSAAAGITLRICTEGTLGRTLWEPEIVLGDVAGHASAVYLSPVSDGSEMVPADRPADNADEVRQHRRHRGDESRWHGDTSSFSVSHATDVDPAGLARVCAPAGALASVLAGRTTLEAMWRTIIGAPYQASVPHWLTAPSVLEGLRSAHRQRPSAAAVDGLPYLVCEQYRAIDARAAADDDDFGIGL